MSRTVYVNGRFVDERDATVSIFDRGFLFADGVYEVSSVLRGRLVDNEAHLARLQRSLAELEMPAPCPLEEIAAIQRRLIALNGLDEGVVYLQVTRGAAERDFKYPSAPRPTLVLFTQAKSLLDDPVATRGIRVITVPDVRWRRRDIKTVGLLAASMARQRAALAGVDDAWMVEDGHVTEGSSNNAFIVTGDAVVTRRLGNEILHGITRKAVLELSRRDGIPVEERAFSVDEAQAAREAFITSASAFVCPVVGIDDREVGSGRPGPVTMKLRRLYVETALAGA